MMDPRWQWYGMAGNTAHGMPAFMVGQGRQSAYGPGSMSPAAPRQFVEAEAPTNVVFRFAISQFFTIQSIHATKIEWLDEAQGVPALAFSEWSQWMDLLTLCARLAQQGNDMLPIALQWGYRYGSAVHPSGQFNGTIGQFRNQLCHAAAHTTPWTQMRRTSWR